jgi:hypothetical protein
MRQATKVQGVEMAKTSATIIAASLVRLGLDVEGSDAEKVGRLVSYYKEKVDKKRLADCDICGGISDVNEPECPYCGDSGVAVGPLHETPAPAEPAPPVAKVSKAKAKATPAPEEAPVEAQAEIIAPPVQAAIVLSSPWTEADLDSAVGRVQELKLQTADRLWELGAAVKQICDNQLWLQRTDENGAPKYKTWGQFTETELEITHSYSYKLMDVAAHYTRDEVRRLGASKLAITLTVPKEKRAELIDAAESASVRELDQMATDIGKEQRDTGRTKKGGAGTHRKDKKKGSKAPAKITVAMLCTRVEIPLHKGAAADKRAKSLLDMPTGEERMFNGVKQRFVVTKDQDGSLILVVERTRE